MTRVKKDKLYALAEEFKTKFIETDGIILRCSVCEVNIAIDDKHQRNRINQHIQYSKHVKNVELRKSKPKQTSLIHAFASGSEKQRSLSEFNADLTMALVQSGIPIYKINNPALKSFLQKYAQRPIPDESTLRKNYVQPIYENVFEKIRETVGKHEVGFILDETTDELQRYILNVLVLPLSGEWVKPMLFKMYELEKTNACTIMQSFNDSCMKLWPGGVQYGNVRLVVTDQARYMLSAFQQLRGMYPNLFHVTCIAHGLHRVCESIRDNYSRVNDFIAALKKILVKAPSRQVLYQEVTGVHLPPFPVITRWGTWIRCAVFLCENFDKIKCFIRALDSTDAAAINQAQQLLNNEDFELELFAVHGYKYLPDVIQSLEEEGMEKEEQWKKLMSVRNKLDGFAKVKFELNLKNNPNVETFATLTELPLRVLTKYAPLVSVDVERSFSTYKDLLSSKRQRLTVKNIEMLCVIQYNKKLFQ